MMVQGPRGRRGEPGPAGEATVAAGSFLTTTDDLVELLVVPIEARTGAVFELWVEAHDDAQTVQSTFGRTVRVLRASEDVSVGSTVIDADVLGAGCDIDVAGVGANLVVTGLPEVGSRTWSAKLYRRA